MTERVALLEEALREQLVHAWTDFDEARRLALVKHLDPGNERSGWSIKMLQLADRIADMSRLVGPSDWEQIPVDLLLDGWWAAVHRRAGLVAPAFDRARAEAVRARRRR